ncbi:MAG: sulfatase, partial [Thermoanaerobaculia bacterium]
YSLWRNGALVVAGVLVLAFWFWREHLAEEGESEVRPPGWGAPGLLVVALAGLGAACAWAYRVPEPQPPTPVLIFLIDALRADELSVSGYPKATTPALDVFARDAVRFRQAIAQSTFTKSSVASLFTGRNPYQHGLYWGTQREASGRIRSDVLVEEETTLAEVFRDHGYLTSAWVQNSHLRSFMGFAQGFVDYHDQQGSVERIASRLEPFLAGPGRRYGFFGYVHFIDLHDPYRPPPPYDRLFARGLDVYRGIDFAEWGAFLDQVRKGERRLSEAELAELRGLYDGQLRRVDDRLGQIFARLKASGLYDRSLIVVTADHGDGFGEHGFISHSTTPYEELVRVPLLLKLPGNRHAGQVVGEQVRLIDLAPTLYDALGWKRRSELAGCSLLPLLATGESSAEREAAWPPACRTAVTEIAEEGAEPALALRTEELKLIHRSGGDELYDLLADPAERHNRIATPGPEGERLLALAATLVEARKASSSRQIQLDERVIRELKALGYVK